METISDLLALSRLRLIGIITLTLFLALALFAGLISVFIGATLGMLAGYYRGGVEELVMATSDVVLLVPGLPLMIILAAYLSPSMWNIILVVGPLWWCSTARVVHSRVLQLREMPFVEAARALGGGDRYIIFHHIRINCREVVYAKLALAVASAMLMSPGLMICACVLGFVMIAMEPERSQKTMEL